MRRIALRSLAHDRGKLATSVAGVAFAATLLLSQIGLYAGFLETSCAIIERAGGDVWIMAKGTEVLENGEMLSSGARAVLAEHPCVASVRPVIMQFSFIRKAGGMIDSVELIGYEPKARGAPMLPWSLLRGLPQDLDGPNRVAVDAFDLPKLQVTGEPLGTRLEVAGQSVYIAALTQGVRSFTLVPNMFAPVDTARSLIGLGDGQANYWVADLRDESCADDVIATVERRAPDVTARTRQSFARATQDYWVAGSGAGTALGFSALLGLVVGTVIVGQTLFSITKEHLRELGTLKAIGATGGELTGFVAWQAAFLAVVGGGLGFVLSFLIRRAVESIGLVVVLSTPVLLVGALAILFMCAVASVGSVRRVLALEAAEVFK
jgi:putative ABC transport system permease protein